jgi:hypothetical protein
MAMRSIPGQIKINCFKGYVFDHVPVSVTYLNTGQFSELTLQTHKKYFGGPSNSMRTDRRINRHDEANNRFLHVPNAPKNTYFNLDMMLQIISSSKQTAESPDKQLKGWFPKQQTH